MKDKNITISLNEYKELLLKERPSDNDKWILGKLKDFIADNCELDSNYKTISIKDRYDFARDILNFLKMIDLEFYKTIVKKCYDNKLEEEETKLRVEKMNAIKELNKSAKESEE
jgi:hypothetical protein